MELKLISGNDPMLRESSSVFDFQVPQYDPDELAASMEEFMDKNRGLGLSAVQVGLPVRVFCMKTNPDITVFNPIIVDASTETTTMDEGCLSYPGLVFKVKRPSLIKVRFSLKNREVMTMKFSGMSARVFQHEMDHLNGIRFMDHASIPKLLLAARRSGKVGYPYRMSEIR